MNIVEFTKIIKYLSMAYNKDFDEDTLRLWYFNFKDIKSDILAQSVKKIIRENKFMPSIAELLEECEKSKETAKYNILTIMKKDGYFADDYEYDKATQFLQEGNIPDWLKKDMEKYNKLLIENKTKLLEG